MYKSVLTFGLLSILLIGAGCVAVDVQPESEEEQDPVEETTEDVDISDADDNEELPDMSDSTELTGHGSEIDSFGVDEALVGTWILTDLSISGQSMNFKGHQLTLGYGGDFSTDYTTEEYTGPTHPAGSCAFAGGTSGTHFERTEVDLDLTQDLDGDGELSDDEIVMINELEIARSGPGDIQVICEAAETITTSVTGMSLGTGPTQAGVHATGAVVYPYEMDDTWSVLTIYAPHVPVVYTYERAN